MKILVCVKNVPDPDGLVFNAGGDGRASMGEAAGYRMNRYDEFAVEEALRIKEKTGMAAIDVLTVGPGRSKEVLRRAVGMGADRGIHLFAGMDGYVSPTVKAAWIADYAKGKNYDLILTGAMSEDMQNAQVAPMVAVFLGLPWATQVICVRLPSGQDGVFAPEETRLSIEREIEGGSREMLEITLPAVFAVQTGINEPRYPSLSNLLRANRQDVETLDMPSPGGEGCKAPDGMAGMVMPKKMRAGRRLEGTPLQKAEALAAILKQRALIS